MPTHGTCTKRRRCTVLRPAEVSKRCFLPPTPCRHAQAPALSPPPFNAPQVSLLLKAGARTDTLDKFGANAHGWAVKYGHTHLLQVLQPDATEAA